MKKLKPKGTPDKTIIIKLSTQERSRFSAFCGLVKMTYSEAFRAMSNAVIKKELKKLGIDLKHKEQQINFRQLDNQPNQLKIWK